MCPLSESPHTAGGFHFVIGELYVALPLLLPPPPHCGFQTLVLAP
ncbi:unnamed protein product [Staurois parvus]|uniref:Uncharacterized protein n=1 Tax=Staurois parvus TaxID=386267 RepID=A0ABN9FWD4_9NEOB|nr:unnamed protein product [Staurois parvus]